MTATIHSARPCMGATLNMFRIMGLENSEDWMNPVQHTEQVIKQGRAFFDSWLEKFPAWPDFVQAVGSNSLAEFGARRGNAVQQVAEWLGGAAEAPHNYANIVKYGVGAPTLHRFTGIPEYTIKAALEALGPTEREKRMLEQIEAERQEALAEAARQAALIKESQQKIDAETAAIQAAKTERSRYQTIARNTKSGPAHEAAKTKEAEFIAAVDEAMQRREAEETTLKQAQKAKKVAEEIATASTKAEAQKRIAAVDQEHYDDKVNKVWEKWVHVNAFRDLCLEPGNQRILPKNKQVEFARYIKKSIIGEVTVSRIHDMFRAHVRNFLAGILTLEKKKLTLAQQFEALLKALVGSMGTTKKKVIQLRWLCDKHKLKKLNDFTALKMEEEISKTIAEFGASCDYFDLNVKCLNYTPPLQEKIVSIC